MPKDVQAELSLGGPTLETFDRDGVTISYEVTGQGFPLLLFAPGGMNSVAQLWRERPGAPGQPMPWVDPARELADEFRVIAMDQRNAGGSVGPVRADDGWHTYAADHLALLEHLGIERAHVMGGCIGSSFCLRVCQEAPERITAAVLQNPIGLSEDNRGDFMAMFDGWAAELTRGRDDIDPTALDSFKQRMFGGEFVFSVDRDFVRRCQMPWQRPVPPTGHRARDRRAGARRRVGAPLDEPHTPCRDAGPDPSLPSSTHAKLTSRGTPPAAGDARGTDC